MRTIEVAPRQLSDYEQVVEGETLAALREAAAPLEGLRLLHVNATSFGGGVSEILASLVPLMRDLGIEARWDVLEADEPFFRFTKGLHNGLQGAPIRFTEEMRDHYLRVNEANASALDDDWDVVVVHDPQPLPLARLARDRADRWLWRCHIDPSNATDPCKALVREYVADYDGSVFSLASYAANGIGAPDPVVIHPSIDPLSSKNRPLSPEEVEHVAWHFGVDPAKPTVSAVGRFDPWKDPLGVIDVYRSIKGRGGLRRRRLPRVFDLYRTVKGKVPDLQLLLIASMAHDDPEGWEYYERALRRAGEDPDIHFLTNLRGVGGDEVNAFQRMSHSALIRSQREGFGLVVAESLWKGVPVVGTPTGGIPLQILDGRTGYLVENARDAAHRVVRLLRDEPLRHRMGEAGRAHVRENFLILRHLRDYLDLLQRMTTPGGADA